MKIIRGTWRWITGKIHGLFRATFGRLFSAGFWSSNVRTVRRTSVRIVRAPFRWVYGLIRLFLAGLRFMVRYWWANKRVGDLLRGLPGFLVIGIVGWICIQGVNQSEYDLGLKYDAAARQALKDDDIKGAELLVRREIELGHNSQATRLEMARLAAANGKSRLSEHLLRDLAPDDRTEFLDAHMYRANQIASRPVDGVQYARLEQHLRHVLIQNPKHREANAMLGQLYFKDRRFNRAIERFESIDKKKRSVADLIMLAKAYRAIGQRSDGVKAALSASIPFGHEYRSDSANPEKMVRYVESLQLADLFDEAVEVLQNATLIQNRELVKDLLATTLIFQGDKIAQMDEDNALSERLKRIDAALKVNPRLPLIYDRILAILNSEEQTDRQEFRQRLLRAQAAGGPPATINLMLGIEAGQRKDWKESIDKYQAALRQDPTLVIAANNLAWSLLQDSPPRVQEAAKVIQVAIDRPNIHPGIRETYAQILVHQGDLAGALDQYELARAQMPGDKLLITQLRDLYR
ncbi:MAG: hypothetical protein AAFN70_00945, partial [Planctomycetota bacterium]